MIFISIRRLLFSVPVIGLSYTVKYVRPLRRLLFSVPVIGLSYTVKYVRPWGELH